MNSAVGNIEQGYMWCADLGLFSDIYRHGMARSYGTPDLSLYEESLY